MRQVRLDHATINTTDLAASLRFYERFLGLRQGWRPDFGFGGAWLYPEDSDDPILHLIECEPLDHEQRHGVGIGMFDHIAFRGHGLREYLDLVRASGEWFEAAPVAGTPFTQVHHFDPNGVRVEVAFEEPLGSATIVASTPPPTASVLHRRTH